MRCLRVAVIGDPLEAAIDAELTPALQPRVVIAANGDAAATRIAGALERAGMECEEAKAAQLEPPSLSDERVIVLTCNVDAANEIASLRRLRRERRESPIVAISAPTTGTGVRRALEAGADAVVFEPELDLTLALAVFAVASGQSIVPRKLRASVEKPVLSFRERQVLAWVSRGYTNAQIADQLYLSESTIKSHLSSAFAKLGVRSRREAAALFLDLENGRGVAA